MTGEQFCKPNLVTIVIKLMKHYNFKTYLSKLIQCCKTKEIGAVQNRTKGFNSLGQSADKDKQAGRPEAEHAVEEGKLDLGDGGGVLQQEVASHHPTSKVVNSSARWSTYQPGGHLSSQLVKLSARWSVHQLGCLGDQGFPLDPW